MCTKPIILQLIKKRETNDKRLDKVWYATASKETCTNKNERQQYFSKILMVCMNEIRNTQVVWGVNNDKKIWNKT